MSGWSLWHDRVGILPRYESGPFGWSGSTAPSTRRSGRRSRKARQNLTDLLDDVKKGREVVITDRGRPVARLAPVERRRPFPDLARVRRAFRGSDLALSQAVLEEREDRL